MPSPVAHLALAPLLTPALNDAPAGGGGGPTASTWRSRIALLALLAALLGPDVDLVVNAVVFGDPFERHGTWSHSVAFVLAAAVAFAAVIRALGVAGWRRAFGVGLVALSVHVLLDFLTVGRGVSLAWPLVPDRFSSPVALFVGVRHPHWTRWDLHAVTLVNEMAFFAACWFAARWWRRRRAASAAATEASAAPATSGGATP